MSQHSNLGRKLLLVTGADNLVARRKLHLASPDGLPFGLASGSANPIGENLNHVIEQAGRKTGTRTPPGLVPENLQYCYVPGKFDCIILSGLQISTSELPRIPVC